MDALLGAWLAAQVAKNALIEIKSERRDETAVTFPGTIKRCVACAVHRNAIDGACLLANVAMDALLSFENVDPSVTVRNVALLRSVVLRSVLDRDNLGWTDEIAKSQRHTSNDGFG